MFTTALIRQLEDDMRGQLSRISGMVPLARGRDKEQVGAALLTCQTNMLLAGVLAELHRVANLLDPGMRQPDA